MNKQQLAWAKQHDWFTRVVSIKAVSYCRPDEDTYTIECKCDEVLCGRVFFNDYNELRDWAGY